MNYQSTKILRKAACLTASLAALNTTTDFSAYAQPFDSSNRTNFQPFLFQTRTQEPIKLTKNKQTIDEQIIRVPLPLTFVQPVPMRGLRIPGLSEKTVKSLGFNYFVVVNNNQFTRMSEIYRENRLNGKSNYITVDSVLHPYFAFTNKLLSEVLLKKIRPTIISLFRAMLTVSLADYKTIDDPEVKEDMEKNIAFLSLSLKLMDLSFEIPAVGNVQKLVETDLKSILEGTDTYSCIFDRQLDFSMCKPIGWYSASDELSNFFRCRQWISQLNYPITDTTTGTEGNRNNNFRRSVLLFRSIDLGKVDGQPAIKTWNKLLQLLTLFGPKVDVGQERILYPSDYKLVFNNNATDLKVTLKQLSEPFYRTKLLLAVRRQKPVNVNATSIFDIESDKTSQGSSVSFHLLPENGYPELPWLRKVAKIYPNRHESASDFPVALLSLHVRGAAQANNIILDKLYTLDPAIAQYLPDLKQCTQQFMPGGTVQPVNDRIWQILSSYFRVYPDGLPTVMRSELWMNRRLESSFAGWLDSLCAFPGPATTSVAATKAPVVNSTPPATDDKTATTTTKNKIPSSFHYVEPCPEVFAQLKADTEKLNIDLTALSLLDARNREKLADFGRLFDRLGKIAESERKIAPISVMDIRLLANFDSILEKIEGPTTAIVSFTAPVEKDQEGHGYSMAIGRPGMLFIILQNPKTMKWVLSRGAMYSYYEASELPATVNALNRDLGSSNPATKLPFWTELFDTIQPAATLKRRHPVQQ